MRQCANTMTVQCTHDLRRDGAHTLRSQLAHWHISISAHYYTRARVCEAGRPAVPTVPMNRRTDDISWVRN